MEQQAYSFILKLVILFLTLFILQASAESLNCTFDDDFCDWKSDSDDDFDWKMFKGVYTDNNYIYIDASYQREGEKARITSPMQNPGAHCLIFWYNMNSRYLGALNIYVKTVNGRKTLIFTKYTSIGSWSWQKAVISRKTNVHFQVVLEGVRGGSYFSDISVDDISLTDGMCTVDCNFEFGICHWVQDLSDDFDWRRHQGGTSTPNTGPPGDHTSGHGYYIYIDTSEVDSNTNARILSPWLRKGKYCFSFWYYMYGRNVKTLTVQTADVNKNKKEIIKITGEQNQQWVQEHAFIHATSDFQILIEGTVRNNWNHDYGDIAIDDVDMLSCQDCVDPTPEYGKTNSNNFTYKSIVQITCNSGYTIKGDNIIVCKAEGIWSASPTCEPVECNYPIPKNAILNSTIFRYGSAVKITCNDGYKISGNSVIYCKANGNWTTSPTCRLIGNNTTYNQTVDIACENGYDLVGNKSITCQADGYWSAPPTCNLSKTTNTSALTAVYVTVPLAAVALVIVLVAIIWRKRILRYCAIRSSLGDPKKGQPQPKTLFTNMAYSENSNENQSNQDGDISQDDEHAVIEHDRNETGQNENPAYYNTAAVTKIKEVEHIYNHTTESGTPVTDNTYSHLAGDEGMSSSTYNTTAFSLSGNATFQSKTNPKNNTYDVLNTKIAKEGCRTDVPPDMKDDQDSEYEHAHAGGTDPTDIDDYSHLNVATDRPKHECTEINYGALYMKDMYTNKVEQTERAKEECIYENEQSVDDTQSVNTAEDDRHYFVLERENSQT